MFPLSVARHPGLIFVLQLFSSFFRWQWRLQLRLFDKYNLRQTNKLTNNSFFLSDNIYLMKNEAREKEENVPLTASRIQSFLQTVWSGTVRCMFAQCREGKTTAMVLEKQLSNWKVLQSHFQTLCHFENAQNLQTWVKGLKNDGRGAMTGGRKWVMWQGSTPIRIKLLNWSKTFCWTFREPKQTSRSTSQTDDITENQNWDLLLNTLNWILKLRNIFRSWFPL